MEGQILYNWPPLRALANADKADPWSAMEDFYAYHSPEESSAYVWEMLKGLMCSDLVLDRSVTERSDYFFFAEQLVACLEAGRKLCMERHNKPVGSVPDGDRAGRSGSEG